MSNNTELINNSNECNWIEEAISKKLIKFYEFSQFYNLQEIGSGGFGKVYRADWKDSHKCCALKYFYNLNDAAIKAIVREIQHHREVDFYDNVIRFYGVTTFKNQIKEYSLVIEYADGGTLRDYLKENFENLTWKDKFSLAFQLVCAVSCLHGEGIVHRDLHSNNILVHQNTVNGRPPFCNELNDLGLAMEILQGLRETPIPDTPEEYIKIYTDCWNTEPDNRPFINQVFDKLKEIIKKENIIIKDFHLFNDNKITQSSNHQQPILDGEISKNIDSLPGDLSQVIQNFNTMNTKEIESSMSSSNQFEINFDTIVNDMININFDNIEVDLGNSSGMCSLGYCYLNGIGTDIDNEKAFELYQKAADLGNSLAQCNLANMYEYEEEITKNLDKAIYWYKKSAEQGVKLKID
ncbi:unnamed protein product [Rhizophagus irregularis]|nr:unnamed protein product [Rhizophagus irregularis]